MFENRDQVVCIIPAFDEEATIADVVRVVACYPHIDRVIVVDDGSEDRTSEKARAIKGIEIVRLNTNRGKGAAMQAGINASNEPLILFLDADLLGMTSQHITDLLEPVISDSADMSVGVFRGGRLFTDLAHLISPSLSGQRAMKRSILTNLDMDTVGFGIERALTDLWHTNSIRVKKVILHGVTHRMKEEKRGYWEGVRQRAQMFADILRFESGRIRRKIDSKISSNPKNGHS
jgi:polyisoprenyl-phosphate glycosyltransferase